MTNVKYEVGMDVRSVVWKELSLRICRLVSGPVIEQVSLQVSEPVGNRVGLHELDDKFSE